MSSATVTAGTTYWIAVLSPVGSGTVKFRDRCCGGAGKVEVSPQSTLATLPGDLVERPRRTATGRSRLYGSGT